MVRTTRSASKSSRRRQRHSSATRPTTTKENTEITSTTTKQKPNNDLQRIKSRMRMEIARAARASNLLPFTAYFMSTLRQEHLVALDHHKYAAGGYTILDSFLNTYWWTPVSKLVQNFQWLSPNMITLSGLCSLLLPLSLALYYTNGNMFDTANLPSWVQILGVICIFFYNTMDAIDGKHARNTKQSSPLGQLFDHGCDSMATLFMSCLVNMSLGLGATGWAYTWVAITFLAFYAGQWHEAHTGTMYTNIGQIGVTEGQYIIIGILALCATFGDTVRYFDLLYIDIAPLLTGINGTIKSFPLHIIFNKALSTTVCLTNAWMTLNFAYNVATGHRHNASRAKTNYGALWGLARLVYANISAILIVTAPDDHLLHNGQVATLLYFTWGLLNSYMASQAIVYATARYHISRIQLSSWPLLIWVLDARFFGFFASTETVWIPFVAAIVAYGTFILRISYQLANHLDIPLLRSLSSHQKRKVESSMQWNQPK